MPLIDPATGEPYRQVYDDIGALREVLEEIIQHAELRPSSTVWAVIPFHLIEKAKAIVNGQGTPSS